MTEGHDPYNHVGRLMERPKFDCQVWLTPEEIAHLNEARIKAVNALFGRTHELSQPRSTQEQIDAVRDWEETIQHYRKAFSNDSSHS